MCKTRQCSADSIAEDFQTSTDINISTKPILWKLYGTGFQGQAAACKCHITKYNAKNWMGGVKHATTGL